jgi:hypothetical protein
MWLVRFDSTRFHFVRQVLPTWLTPNLVSFCVVLLRQNACRFRPPFAVPSLRRHVRTPLGQRESQPRPTFRGDAVLPRHRPCPSSWRASAGVAERYQSSIQCCSPCRPGRCRR